jgi:translation initiation factor 2 beta subunit (eIF-2beta)/eIF-5
VIESPHPRLCPEQRAAGIAGEPIEGELQDEQEHFITCPICGQMTPILPRP